MQQVDAEEPQIDTDERGMRSGLTIETGGVAALNHPLIAAIPPG